MAAGVDTERIDCASRERLKLHPTRMQHHRPSCLALRPRLARRLSSCPPPNPRRSLNSCLRVQQTQASASAPRQHSRGLSTLPCPRPADSSAAYAARPLLAPLQRSMTPTRARKRSARAASSVSAITSFAFSTTGTPPAPLPDPPCAPRCLVYIDYVGRIFHHFFDNQHAASALAGSTIRPPNPCREQVPQPQRQHFRSAPSRPNEDRRTRGPRPLRSL